MRHLGLTGTNSSLKLWSVLTSSSESLLAKPRRGFKHRLLRVSLPSWFIYSGSRRASTATRTRRASRSVTCTRKLPSVPGTSTLGSALRTDRHRRSQPKGYKPKIEWNGQSGAVEVARLKPLKKGLPSLGRNHDPLQLHLNKVKSVHASKRLFLGIDLQENS